MTLLPLAWLAAATLTAGWQKVFADDPRLSRAADMQVMGVAFHPDGLLAQFVQKQGAEILWAQIRPMARVFGQVIHRRAQKRAYMVLPQLGRRGIAARTRGNPLGQGDQVAQTVGQGAGQAIPDQRRDQVQPVGQPFRPGLAQRVPP